MFKIILIISIVLGTSLSADIGYNENQIIARLKKVNGDTTEHLMHQIFKKDGWLRLEGEINGRGIDGLYYKPNMFGSIKQVMIAEAKYNTSELNIKTRQMSKEWIESRLANLIRQYPNETKYKTIQKFVHNNMHRTILFNTKILNNNKLDIKFSSIVERNNMVFTKHLDTKRIDMNYPRTNFEKQIKEIWRNGQTQAIGKNFNLNISDSAAVTKLSKNSLIDRKSLYRVLEYRTQISRKTGLAFGRNSVVSYNQNQPIGYIKPKIKRYSYTNIKRVLRYVK